MNLDDWVRSGRLHRELPTFPEVERLLAAAARNLVDAALDGLSDESRFDLAYKAIVQSALVALRASGYRPATNVPGHHHTLVQSLRLTIHAGDAELRLLDMIRRRRNANDYAGRPIEEALAAECLLKGRVARAGAKVACRDASGVAAALAAA